MNAAALRTLVLDLNFSVHGAPVTVTPVVGPVIATTGIWLTPLAEEMPVGHDFQRREPRRVLALRVSKVGAVARGSTIVAAERGIGALRTWRVDGVEQLDSEQIRVILTPA